MNRSSVQRLLQRLGLLAAAFLLPAIHAGPVFWDRDVAGSSDWRAGIAGSDTNWSGNGFPAPSDDVVIDEPASGGSWACTLTLAETVANLTVGAVPANVTLDYPKLVITGTNLTTSGGFHIAASAGHQGRVEVSLGNLAIDFMNIGSGGCFNGEVDVSSSSNVSVSTQSFVGRDAGVGSLYLGDSNFSTDELFVGEGDSLASGYVSASNSTINVFSRCEIGSDGIGTVDLANGSEFFAPELLVGVQSGSNGAVYGFGATMNLTGPLRVGIPERPRFRSANPSTAPMPISGSRMTPSSRAASRR